MVEIKTKKTEASVKKFLEGVEDEQKRKDSQALVKMMEKASGFSPKMWGESIVGFGEYHYKYASGHEGDTCIIGFSPRKAALTLYVMLGLYQHGDMLSKLGKYKLGKGCLYIKRLSDVDLKVLEEFLNFAVHDVESKKSESGIKA